MAAERDDALAEQGRRKLALDLSELARLYVAGETADRLAVKFGVSVPTVLRRLREANVPIRQRGGRPAGTGRPDKTCMLTVTPEAHALVMDCARRSGMSGKDLASAAIIAAYAGRDADKERSVR